MSPLSGKLCNMFACAFSAMVPTLLTALGFSAYQSAFGATTMFSTLQSVGMAGMAGST